MSDFCKFDALFLEAHKGDVGRLWGAGYAV